MQVFLFTILYGVIGGLIISVFSFIRHIFGNNKVITIITDLISTLLAGGLFIFCIFKYNFGIIRLYEILGFIVGIFTEIISVGKIVDFLGINIYNKIRKIVKRIASHKMGRRKKDEAVTIKQVN